jgi:hypothetical protein
MLLAEDTADINFWILLKQDNNYEINDVSSKIRNVETKREIYFCNNKNGYKFMLTILIEIKITIQ